MPTLIFPLAVIALVAATLATRLAVLQGRFDDLPSMPSEH
jgi:hypothetical protein